MMSGVERPAWNVRRPIYPGNLLGEWQGLPEIIAQGQIIGKNPGAVFYLR